MSHTIAPARSYFAIYAILVALMMLTIGAAHLDLGNGNLPVALLIAGIKGTLIVLFFMHVKDGPKLTRVFAGSAFVWLIILLVLTMMDYLSRGWLNIPGK